MNKRQRADYMKEWRAKQSPEWWENNRKYMKKWRDDLPEDEKRALDAKRKLDYYQNRGYYLNRMRERVEAIMADPEKSKEFINYRRIAKRARIRGVTIAEWENLLEMFDHCCAYCRTNFSSTNIPEADHMIPPDVGGPRSVHNVVPSCRSCNATKQKRHVVKFLLDLWGKG